MTIEFRPWLHYQPIESQSEAREITVGQYRFRISGFGLLRKQFAAYFGHHQCILGPTVSAAHSANPRANMGEGAAEKKDRMRGIRDAGRTGGMRSNLAIEDVEVCLISSLARPGLNSNASASPKFAICFRGGRRFQVGCIHASV